MARWGKSGSRGKRRQGTPGREELEVLFAFSRALVGAAGVGEVAQALFRAVDDLLDIEQCLLLGVSEDQQRAVGLAAMTGLDTEIGRLEIDLVQDSSAIAQVVRERAPHRVLDGERETLHSRQIAQMTGARSALYVPLQTSAGVIAVLVVASVDSPRRFRREEVEIVAKLAADGAAAIERARFAQALREVGERELIVAGVARSIRETLDPDELLATAAREVGEQADCDRVRLWLTWSDQLDGRGVVWADDRCTPLPWDEESLPVGARLALRDRQPVPARATPESPAGSELSLPLVQRGATLGVMTIERSAASFDDAEVRLIELVAVEIAAALEYVRLYRGGRRHLDEQLALARAAQSLTADLRLDRVMDHIVEEVVEVMRTSSAAFYVYDRDERMLTLRAARGSEERRVLGERMAPIGLAGRVVTTGVAHYTNDYRAELGHEIHPVFHDVTRAIAVPVRWQGDLRGVISLASREQGRMFTERDIRLLEAFADLASLALHNADAYSAHARQARIQAGFYRISRVLSQGMSRTQTVDALAQAAAEALDAEWTLVMGVGRGDGVVGTFHLEASSMAPDTIAEIISALDLGEDAQSPAALALERRRTVTSRDLAGDRRFTQEWRDALLNQGVASLLAVPVRASGGEPAVVIACYTAARRFGDEELVVAGNLANTAGAALERANLFENERRMRQLSQVLAEVSGLLAETLKAQTVLDRIVEQASVLLNADACTLTVVHEVQGRRAAVRAEASLADGDLELVLHAAAGRDEQLVNALRGSDVGSQVEEVARSRRAISIDRFAGETSGQPLRDASYGGYLGVPLMHPRGYLIGVLSIYSGADRTFTEGEVEALESFASSAAIAIRNAELYADVKRERDTVDVLLASIGEGIAATDAAGRITLWNDAAEQVTGISQSEAVGRLWRDTLGVGVEVDPAAGQGVIEARPAGTSMWLSMTASPLRGRAGSPGSGGWILAFHDVSAHHQLERLKTDFVSTVSYVLRAPLAAVYGFARTLQREDMQFSDEDRAQFMTYIVDETERLRRVVDDLIEVARIEADTVDVLVADTDVATVLDRVVSRIRNRIAEGGRAAPRLEVSWHGDLRARADSERLDTVLTNLIDNAVRQSPDSGTVRVEAHRQNGAVVLSVQDGGLPIPPAEQKHLFEKFYVSPLPGDDHGTGLGLYISRGLIQAMGGTIGVSSREGSGSTFTVELPVAGTAATGVEGSADGN